MVSCGWNCDALNGLYIIGKFDELHLFIIETLFDNSFANCVDHFHAVIFLNDSYLIFCF